MPFKEAKSWVFKLIESLNPQPSTSSNEFAQGRPVVGLLSAEVTREGLSQYRYNMSLRAMIPRENAKDEDGLLEDVDAMIALIRNVSDPLYEIEPTFRCLRTQQAGGDTDIIMLQFSITWKEDVV